jgi:hypothetical protein
MTDDRVSGPAGPVTSPGHGDEMETRVLLILAVDHRNSLERDLCGLTAPPSSHVPSTPHRRQRPAGDSTTPTMLDPPPRSNAGHNRWG